MFGLTLEILFLISLFIIGFFAGILNAVAGGATFLTFPALMLAGLSPVSANATNFIATAPGNIAALPAFKNELRTIGKSIYGAILICSFGSILGAVILFSLGADIFKSLIPYLMGFATLLFIIAPKLRKKFVGLSLSSQKLPIILLFAFSIYGGYFGAGLGQIALAVLLLIGFEDLRTANAMKNAVIASISLPASIIYIMSGEVFWPYAIVMFLGSAGGGYAGGRLAISLPQDCIRKIVIIFGALLTLYYFFMK